MSLFDQSGVTGGGLDPYNALFVNMDNMWTERFGNYDCLVNFLHHHVFMGISTPNNFSPIVQFSPIHINLGVLIRQGDRVVF